MDIALVEGHGEPYGPGVFELLRPRATLLVVEVVHHEDEAVERLLRSGMDSDPLRATDYFGSSRTWWNFSGREGNLRNSVLHMSHMSESARTLSSWSQPSTVSTLTGLLAI